MMTTDKITRSEIDYAIELLDAPGGDDPQSETLRILMRAGMSEREAVTTPSRQPRYQPRRSHRRRRDE